MAAEAQSPTKSFTEQMKRAVLWLKWATKYTVKWEKDIEVNEGEEANRQRRKRNEERVMRMAGRGSQSKLEREVWQKKRRSSVQKMRDIVGNDVKVLGVTLQRERSGKSC